MERDAHTVPQDLTDTATVLQLRDTLKLVEGLLVQIVSALETLCEKYKTTPMAGRSNLQQAVPMSFGFKMARLLAQFRRHQDRLKELKPRLLVLEFGGAVGTLATISESASHAPAPQDSVKEGLGLQCQRLLAEELGLGMPSIAWHCERDSIAEVGTYFALLTSTCAKFATDLKIMMMPEIGEASEPFVHSRGSSSTMPQKRNPIGSAYICAMASSVRSMSVGLCEASVADFERSTGPWEIEWILLPQACALTHAVVKQTNYLLSGLEVSPENMARNLELTQGNVVSEAVMMGLGKTLGRSYAHDLVYDVCRQAVVEQTPLIDLLLKNEDIKRSKVPEDELRRLCDPGQYLGWSAEMVDRVLQSKD